MGFDFANNGSRKITEEVSAGERIGKRFGSRLSRASSAIDKKSDDVYAHVAGALYRVFLTLTIQSARAYFIFVIKLFVWSIVPLTTIIAVLLQLAPLSPALIIVCYGAIAVILWTVATVFFNSLKPQEIEPQETLETTDDVIIAKPTRNKLFASIGSILSALTTMIRDLFKGRIKPLFTLGLLIRVLGLAIFLVLNYANNLFGQEIGESLRWLKNEIYWIEFGIFDTIVAQPFLNVANFIISTAASFGFYF